MVDISKFRQGKNEQLLKVSALYSKSSFQSLEKNFRGGGGGIHPHPSYVRRLI